MKRFSTRREDDGVHAGESDNVAEAHPRRLGRSNNEAERAQREARPREGLFKQSLKSNEGFSLIEQLIGLGVSLGVLVIMGTFIANITQQEQRNRQKLSLKGLQNNLLTAIANPDVLRETMIANNFQCALQDPFDGAGNPVQACSITTAAAPTVGNLQPVAGFTETFIDGVATRTYNIRLQRTVGGAQFLFNENNPVSRPAEGYTALGEECSTYPSNACPLRLSIQISFQCGNVAIPIPSNTPCPSSVIRSQIRVADGITNPLPRINLRQYDITAVANTGFNPYDSAGCPVGSPGCPPCLPGSPGCPPSTPPPPPPGPCPVGTPGCPPLTPPPLPPPPITQIGGLAQTLGLSAGHGCIIDGNNRAHCWGKLTGTNMLNNFSVNASGTASTSPTALEITGNMNDWTNISTGAEIACGIRGGQLFCWGNNDRGQLGTGTTTDSLDLIEVYGGHSDWTFITTSKVESAQSACGLRNGQAFCWGFDSNEGALGDGADGGTPGECWNGPLERHHPTPVAAPTGAAGPIQDFVKIASAYKTYCGLTAANEIWCWGDNFSGETGNGTNRDSCAPEKIAGGFSDWIDIDGGLHHFCAVRSGGGGSAYCWGRGAEGRLGNGQSIQQNTPVQVSGPNGWTHISTGYDHSCGIRNNQAYCWGMEWEGKLGNGQTGWVERNTPVLVSGGFNDWDGIVSGEGTTCGKRTIDDCIYCWGDNRQNQLGIAATGILTTPTQSFCPAAAPPPVIPPVVPPPSPLPGLAELVLELKFENPVGVATAGDVVTDTSGNNNHGVVVTSGAGCTPISFESGVKPGGVALKMSDNSNFHPSYIEVPDSASLRVSTGLTLSVWMKLVKNSFGYYSHSGFAKKNVVGNPDNNNQDSFLLRIQNFGSAAAFCIEPSSYLCVEQPIPGGYQSDVWVHLAGTWDGSLMRTYVNGVEGATTRAFNGPMVYTNNGLFVGVEHQKPGSAQEHHTGDFGQAIDELKVWNRALTAAEVLQVYDLEKP